MSGSAAYPEGVLFDMDGLLLDSERLARDAFVRACEDHGYAADLVTYQQCIGSTYDKTRELIMAAYGEDFPYEAIDERWSHHYHARLAKGPVPVKDGALALLTHLRVRDAHGAGDVHPPGNSGREARSNRIDPVFLEASSAAVRPSAASRIRIRIWPALPDSSSNRPVAGRWKIQRTGCGRR